MNIDPNTNKHFIDYIEVIFDVTPDKVKLARPSMVQPIVYTFLDKKIQFVTGPEYDDKFIFVTRKNDDFLMISIMEPDNREEEIRNVEAIGEFTKRHLNEPFKKMPAELAVLLLCRMDVAVRRDNISYGVYELTCDGNTFIFK